MGVGGPESQGDPFLPRLCGRLILLVWATWNIGISDLEVEVLSDTPVFLILAVYYNCGEAC